MTTSLESARDTLAAVRETHATLLEVYSSREPQAEHEKRYRAKTVAGLHEAIRYGLKAAEVEALVSIAGSLKVLELAHDDEPCCDLAPALTFNPDSPPIECAKAYGHRSRWHEGPDGERWTEGDEAREVGL